MKKEGSMSVQEAWARVLRRSGGRADSEYRERYANKTGQKIKIRKISVKDLSSTEKK